MHLHQFLVDYYKNSCEGGEDNIIDVIIFVDDMCDNGVFNMGILNDSNTGDGDRPINMERRRCINRVLIRCELRKSLQNYNIHSPQQNNAWNYDRSNHIILNAT